MAEIFMHLRLRYFTPFTLGYRFLTEVRIHNLQNYPHATAVLILPQALTRNTAVWRLPVRDCTFLGEFWPAQTFPWRRTACLLSSTLHRWPGELIGALLSHHAPSNKKANNRQACWMCGFLPYSTGRSQETLSASTKVEMGTTRGSEQKNTRDNNICIGQTRKLFPPVRQLFMLYIGKQHLWAICLNAQWKFKPRNFTMTKNVESKIITQTN